MKNFFRRTALALGAVLLMTPAVALAERHRVFIEPRVEVYRHNHHHWRSYYVDPRVPRAPAGHYDAWGYWHPYR